MKRFLILGVCTLWCSSFVAQAELLQVIDTADSSLLGTITVTRTDMLDGTDQLLLTLTTISGHAAGGAINVVEGTWTPSAGSIFVAQGLSTALTTGTRKWGARSTVSGAEIEPETSWVNLDSVNGALDPITGKYNTTPAPPLLPVEMWNRSGTWTAGAVLRWTAPGSNFLKGAWFSTGSALSPDADLASGLRDLATLYVTTGSNVSFNGKLGYTSGGGSSYPVLITHNIPEPSTLVLLGMGLLGLVCYACRKRK